MDCSPLGFSVHGISQCIRRKKVLYHFIEEIEFLGECDIVKDDQTASKLLLQDIEYNSLCYKITYWVLWTLRYYDLSLTCAFVVSSSPLVSFLSRQHTMVFAWCCRLSVQFSSVTQSCPTLRDPMNRSTPSYLRPDNPAEGLLLLSPKTKDLGLVQFAQNMKQSMSSDSVDKHTVKVLRIIAMMKIVVCQALCQRGASPGKNTGAYWPILVVISFQSTILPIGLAANPPEYLVLPEPL
ncbi:hypothetical protein MG293_000763 [Ovis ammon polii]|uniref:Uncharacterized protein n=1 Tax=Ovis ammon polii TaxID=230172 RepID=A0AAD4UJM9_OVIAM|nr:hypothetical protein MG293_000763 [Ovis ammon polii]